MPALSPLDVASVEIRHIGPPATGDRARLLRTKVAAALRDVATSLVS